MCARAKETTLRFYKERLLRVLVEIQQRLDEPMRLEELAALACISPYHFHHVFTGMVGESLAVHNRRLRLERAAWRLKLNRVPVVQIAMEAGYQTHEAFSRAFRGSFGMSPTQFRTRNGVNSKIHASSGVHFRADAKPGTFRTGRLGGKIMHVTVKHQRPLRVAFMRHVGPYNQVGKTWDRFCMILGKEGLLGGDAHFIGICHDDPAVTPRHRIRYDACVTVDGRFRAAGEVGVQTVAGGDHAVLTHFGPYEKLGESYAKLLGEWLPRSGRMLRSSPCFEICLNSPENTDPKDLITDIHAPLETRQPQRTDEKDPHARQN